MDVYFSDQVNDPTLRLFSSTKTLGSDSFDYNIKLEDDPVMSSAIAAATAGSLMDISDMMQDAQSDKASENNFDDSRSDAPINNNNNSNAHSNYNHVNRHRDYEEKLESSKPQPHTPSYMPQHHNIDQVRFVLPLQHRMTMMLAFVLCFFFLFWCNGSVTKSLLVSVSPFMEQFSWQYVQGFP